jgi:hypothetical protein
MRIQSATRASVFELCNDVRARLEGSTSVEDGAQALTERIYDRFRESVVLARVFVTIPFHALPATNKAFVEGLAGSAARESLKPGTPVLSLIGTSGDETVWGDRRNSRGHIGIPLISSTFVGGIPMISRLLYELGVPLDWVDSHNPSVITEKLGESTGLFFVDDAATAVDPQGRKIITAQDFVSEYGVKTVFGLGTVYDTGQILVAVVFCRDRFPRTKAETFLEAIETLKGRTAGLVSRGAVFQKAA